MIKIAFESSFVRYASSQGSQREDATIQGINNMYISDIQHNPPVGFAVREATYNDVDELTRLWFTSFNSSHDFWKAMTPEDPKTHQWLNDLWALGIKSGPSVLRTFVVEDVSNKKLAAFARWNPPQADGKQDIPIPAYPSHWDSELIDALWEGMPRNRAEVMGSKPHWSVDKGYQSKGLGKRLMEWGCRQADAKSLEVYLDATINGRPLYNKWFDFQDRKLLTIPSRPDSFGTYYVMSMVRPAMLKSTPLRHGLVTESVTDSNGFLWEGVPSLKK
ncbi:acyl-CoA N-acyltransferase [Drechslerella dactyloides]|uniref:Acyl-CoA N-acyltransferase n=1 Tax=Drechslerella dactyloides TaxID=74499 RepID=A0AAD6IWT8_DREDA|nr:acyl-CoA N-acyltransferase [Drechslerella dactyloides]